MKRISVVVVSCLFAAAVVYAGCAGGGVGRGLSVKNLGKEKLVEKSGSRPKWAFERPMYVKGGILYASAAFTDVPNLGKGLHIATKLAQAKIIESIQVRLKDDFTYASEGLDIESTIVERILNSTTEEIIVNGLFQNQLYYEKKMVLTQSGWKVRYDCYALIEISKENYLVAVDRAISGNLHGPVSKQFREKVDERQRMFFRLDESPKAGDESAKNVAGAKERKDVTTEAR